MSEVDAQGNSQHATETARLRVPAFDGLRSLIIVVLLVHFSDSLSLSGAGATGFYFLLLSGVVGLDVFFVLSGFLITGILLDTKDSPGYFRNFYARRALRILPVYYGTLLVFLVALPYFTTRFPDLRLTPIQQIPYWAYLVNIAAGLGWPMVPATGHFWSLALEEQFYLLWPAVVLLCSRGQLRRVCLLCLVGAPLARLILVKALPSTVAFAMLTPARVDGLALGALLAIFARSPGGLAPLKRWVKPIGAAAAAIFVATAVLARPASLAGPFGIGQPILLTASVYAAGAVFLMTLTSAAQTHWSKLVGSWPLRRIGMYSYAMYVLHDPLEHVLDRMGLLPVPVGGIADGARYCAIMVPLTIAVGALSWHAFERPVLQLQKRFPYRRRAN